MALVVLLTLLLALDWLALWYGCDSRDRLALRRGAPRRAGDRLARLARIVCPCKWA